MFVSKLLMLKTTTRHFQYRVENFFKYIVMNGNLGKVFHYAIRVEFQVRVLTFNSLQIELKKL